MMYNGLFNALRTQKKKGDDDDDDRDPPDDSGYSGDLRSLCLTSKKFREIAQPLLFQYFDDSDLDGDLSKTIQFARTIYRRPDLANHIQHLSIVPILPREEEDGDIPINPEDFKLFAEDIKNLNFSDSDSWVKCMQNRDVSVLTALVANKASNIRSIVVPRSFNMKRFTQVFERNPKFLSRLECFWAENDDEVTFSLDLKKFNKIFQLPMLKDLTFEVASFCNASQLKWAPSSLKVQKLFFRQCHIDGDSVQTLIKSCNKLVELGITNFTVDPHRRPLSEGLPAEFTATELYEAVLLHKDTLEMFKVDFYRGSFERQVDLYRASVEPLDCEEYVATRPKFGSFRDFSVLSNILVPHANLNDHPQFPEAIRDIIITDCTCSIRSMASNIATDCRKGMYPHLTSIKVLTLDVTWPIKLPGQIVPPGKTPYDCFVELQDLFKGTYVDFQICPYELPSFEDDSDVEDGFGDIDDINEDGAGQGRLPGLDEMPGLFDMIMQRAMQDPDFAHLRPGTGPHRGAGNRG